MQTALLLSCLLALGAAAPGLDATLRQLRKSCLQDKTGVSCLQYRLLSVLDQALSKDSYQVSEEVSVVRNSEPGSGELGGQEEARATDGLLESLQTYVRTHDVHVRLPWQSSLQLSARNIDSDQLDLQLRFSDSAIEEGRRSKLKRIIVPILVFVLLKAITLIPLFIGVLGLKAWNALQLSFFSFVISVALAIFQLCRKIASDAAQQPQIATHGGWDNYARSHDLAYRGQAPSHLLTTPQPPLFMSPHH